MGPVLRVSVAAVGVTTESTPQFAWAAKAKAFDDLLHAAVDWLALESTGAKMGAYE